RDRHVTEVQACALPIWAAQRGPRPPLSRAVRRPAGPSVPRAVGLASRRTARPSARRPGGPLLHPLLRTPAAPTDERTPMAVSEGANYAPAPMPKPVVEPGEFVFAAMHLDHGHIGGMTQGLLDAGGTLKWVYDTQPERAAA